MEGWDVSPIESDSSPDSTPTSAGSPLSISKQSALPSFSTCCPSEDDSDWYIGGVVIGHGSFGWVRRAMDKATGRIFVVKSLDLRSVPFGDSEDEAGCRDAFSSAPWIEDCLSRWKEMSHPNLVQILGYANTGCGIDMHLELTTDGSLENFLQDFGPLGQGLFNRVIRGVFQGLQHLHTRERPLAHGNLRGATICVDGSPLTAKLTDVGLSSGLKSGPLPLPRDSLPWTAPEVVCGQDSDPEADVWSAGCLMIEMLTAREPWGDAALADIEDALRGGSARPRLPEAMPELAETAARNCLVVAPHGRASVCDLLALFCAEECED
mmetsp:Transcript_100544/g.307266  ORF Transcript_100544/g.307266 Transcript_100544/m.307266 type:complete len:323 (-) Transcript_100544:499-1467(-)